MTTGASSNVGGYITELGRTMFLGEASDEHRHYCAHMKALQALAIDTAGPGVPVAAVDQAVHDYGNEHGLLEYMQTPHRAQHRDGRPRTRVHRPSQ
ncbi:M24 family metallopeptidase [Natrononativus amylolyticus]|uniref:M24 family metallopeptidase n=1 Tax=Natrononativus amylolyticus TaxID=2963434 RepID=UPI0020CD8BA1|nr:M24 family metallopeptidase [Natrononativus amylolyticus]